MSELVAGHQPKQHVSHRVPMRLSQISWYGLCGLLSLTMLLPLLSMLSIALKPASDIMSIPPEFFPSSFKWSNFITGPEQIGFYHLLYNTVIVSALYVFGAVSSSMLAGYAISRIRFAGRKWWFYLFTFSIFVPGIVTLIPIQRMFFSLGFVDSWVPLWLPAFFGNPVLIFLARQYFMSVPRYIDDAAMIDGAGHWRIFTQLMIPLTKPLWITMIILSFQGAWNDYLNPLVYLSTPSKYTLSLGMANYVSTLASGGSPQYNFYMASNLLYMIPPLLLFFFAQRYFMQGLGALGMASK